MLNRFCNKTEINLIYEGDIENRVEVADFAMNFIHLIFDERKR